MGIKQFLHKQLTSLFFFIKTRTYKGRIKYLFENNNSNKLVISFTAFSDTPCFNYYRTLKEIKADKLFLQDNFGYKGSYLLFENGTDLPKVLTMGLLNKILGKKNYEKIITLGTSKGGADSIIFGLEIGASDIYSGASQYYLGKYLNSEGREEIFRAMMGSDAGKKEQAILDAVMPNILSQYGNSNSHIYILYSKAEHTYDDHIKYMIEDLNKTNIKYTEIVENFEDHNDVGKYFSPFIQNHIK